MFVRVPTMSKNETMRLGKRKRKRERERQRERGGANERKRHGVYKFPKGRLT